VHDGWLVWLRRNESTSRLARMLRRSHAGNRAQLQKENATW